MFYNILGLLLLAVTVITQFSDSGIIGGSLGLYYIIDSEDNNYTLIKQSSTCIKQLVPCYLNRSKGFTMV